MTYSKHECGAIWVKPKENQLGLLEAKPPQPSTIVILAKPVQKSLTSKQNWMPLTSFPTLEEFSYLHPSIKSSKINPISTLDPWEFSRDHLNQDPSLSVIQSLNQNKEPTTPWLSRKWQGKAETIVNPWKSSANDNKHKQITNACTIHLNPDMLNITCTLLPEIHSEFMSILLIIQTSSCAPFLFLLACPSVFSFSFVENRSKAR